MIGIKRETIREYNNNVIGYVDILPNGDKEIRDSRGRYLGKYDKHMNVTKDKYGRTIFRGDQSSMLFNRKQ